MIVGAIPSPTPYKIRTQQAEHYLRCGADILLNGLEQSVQGEAKCVVCGSVVQLNMTDGRVNGLEPGTAILHVVELPMGEGRISIECESTHLFDTEKCLQSWLAGYGGRAGLVFRPQEFLDHLSRGGTARVAIGKR